MGMLYIFFIGIGLIINIIMNVYGLKKKKISSKDIFYIQILQIITLIMGCKILDVSVNFNYYIYYNWFQAIRSGYMFYGGIIFSIYSVYIYAKTKKIDVESVFEILIPNILLLYSICKIGCFCNGCCGGKYGIPIQIIESISCFIIYFLLLKCFKPSSRIYYTFIFYGIIRVLVFLFRDKISMINFVINEIISICILLVGFKLLLKHKRGEVYEKIKFNSCI